MDIANSRNLTYNDEKCVFSTKSLNALGYFISEGTIKPDPERLHPLQELPISPDKALKRVIGLFLYYYSKFLTQNCSIGKNHLVSSKQRRNRCFQIIEI